MPEKYREVIDLIIDILLRDEEENFFANIFSPKDPICFASTDKQTNKQINTQTTMMTPTRVINYEKTEGRNSSRHDAGKSEGLVAKPLVKDDKKYT